MSYKKLIPLLMIVALVAACGRKEPPKPPPSKIPAPIDDLLVQQRGQEVIFTMSFPNVTLGGLPIDELESVEIWKMSRVISTLVAPIDEIAEDEGTEDAEEEAPTSEIEPIEETEEEPEEEPETSLFSLPTSAEGLEEETAKEDLITVSGRDFGVVSQLAWTLRGTELDSAVIGDQLVVKVPIDELARHDGEEEVLVFGARSVAGKRRASPFSNLQKLYPRVPPAAPYELSVEATPDGVQIDWQIDEEALGYRVYRRIAKVRDYGEPVYKAREGLGTYLDRTAVFGDRYIYAVTSVGNLNPLVESAIAAEREVNFKDRFPPTTPTEIVALPETGRVRLLWQPSISPDTQGYWIYRQDPGGSFEAVNTDLVVGSEYLDSDLPSGVVYRYFILAIDAKGNESEPSEEIEVRVP